MNPVLDSVVIDGGDSSTLVVIALAVSTLELLAGMGLGWWLRGNKKVVVTRIENGMHEAQHALSNLHELAHRVKADVGAHSSQVVAISNELNTTREEGAAPDTKVLSAVSKILEAN